MSRRPHPPTALPVLGLLALVGLALLGVGLAAGRVRGDDPPVFDPQVARKALMDAVARGRELFQKKWNEGGKSCADCHTQGPNRLRAARLKSYPKYDLDAQKVITGQQKMNEMLREKVKTKPMELGSDDLNALEAFVSTLR